jgi:hypothetical protein
MIVVAGDSWGCGEWGLDSCNPDAPFKITHGGLSEYLKATHRVVNISKPGGSNWQTYERIKNFFASGCADNLTEKVTHVFVFQTEWWRDFGLRTPYPSDYISYNFKKFNSQFPTEIIYNWYYRLSDLAQKYSVKILLIGGVADTEYFENFEKEIPGLAVVCQSFVNLCVNDVHTVSEPCWGLLDADVVVHIKKHINNNLDFEYLNAEISKSQNRTNIFHSEKEWFWPDQRHANRCAHLKLYNHVKQFV